MSEDSEKVFHILKHFNTGLLVTHRDGDHGTIGARPMAIAEATSAADVWFFASTQSETVSEIAGGPDVALLFQSNERYLRLSGRASLSQSAATIERLWKEPYKVWFPLGKADPQLVLIHFHPFEAEYWDSSGVKGIRYLLQAAHAYVTGTTPSESADLHGTVEL